MLHRQQRVADAIRDAVAAIVTSGLADPDIGFATVTRCRVTRDLKLATVFVSFMGDRERQQAGLHALERARGFIRRQLRDHVQLRYLPELRFRLDDVIDHERRVDGILEDLFPDKHRDATDLDTPEAGE